MRRRRGVRAAFAAAFAVVFLLAPIARADAPTVPVIEYYHAELDHYFITSDPVEINALDTHYFAGWERTGRRFDAYPLGTPGRAPVCRFFSTSFGAKSSHFYTPFDFECEYVKLNPDWQFEGDRLAVALPDGAGVCPADTVPVYRLFNNGMGGAPNHRFVTSAADRQAMIAKGYADEGVGMCAAAPVAVAGTAEGKWRGTTADHRNVDLWVLADGTYYAVVSQPDSASTDSTVVIGTGASANGTFTSANAREFLFRHDPAFMALAPPALQAATGTFVPKQTMQLTIGGRSVTFTYDPAYEMAANAAALQGAYAGNAGHFADPHDGSTASFDANGNFSMTSTECQAGGTLTPRAGANVFDAGVLGILYQCVFALPTVTPGIGLYDAATRLIRVLVKFNGGADLWFFVGGH